METENNILFADFYWNNLSGMEEEFHLSCSVNLSFNKELNQ